jgi:cysteine synthase A
MKEGILSTIGNTPLVRLTRALKAVHFRLYAKVEAFNPGGSIKDRAALSIIRHAIDMGDIRPGTTVIESSSGNMGIGLAQVCAYFGLRFICVIDPKTTRQNINILKAYGAEIDLVSKPDPHTGEFLPARINRVKTLLRLHRNSFWTDQYSNRYNAVAHHQTMHEVITELDGKVDYLVCAASTCGTLRGCAEYARDHHLGTKLVAVDAVGSVIFGGKPAKRLIPGHGAAQRPALYQPDLVDRCIHVADIDCVVGCRRLLRQEAILAGGSSGGVLMAVERLKQDIPPDATCVVIFPDRGERYLDTIYSDSWVREHFGDISHLWQR